MGGPESKPTITLIPQCATMFKEVAGRRNGTLPLQVHCLEVGGKLKIFFSVIRDITCLSSPRSFYDLAI